MALPVYAKSLFGLLKFIGWEQQEVAKRLSVSVSVVSLWATGKRPVTKRYEPAFLDLVMQSLEEQLERYGKNSTHAREMAAYMAAWANEMLLNTNRIQQSLRRTFEILKSSYAKTDIRTLSKTERRLLKSTFQLGAHYLDYLESIGKPIRASTVTKMDPLESFIRLRVSYVEGDAREG